MNVQESFEKLRDDLLDWVTNNIVVRVPITRTINMKPLSEDITLSATDVGADPAGTADQVFNNMKEYVNTTSKYGSCSTGSAIKDKLVSCKDFKLTVGAYVTVKFLNTNTVTEPRLNVNNTGAFPIFYRGNPIPVEITGATCIQANSTYSFMYNGTQWDLVGVLISVPDKYATTIKDLTVLHDQMTYTKLDGTTGNVPGYAEHIGKKLDGDNKVTGVSRVDGNYVLNTSDSGNIRLALHKDVTDLSTELKNEIKDLSDNIDTDMSNLTSSTDQALSNLSNKLANGLADLSDEVDEKIAAVNTDITELENKVNTVNTNLTNKINTVNTNLTNSINTVNTNLTNKINVLDSRVTTEVTNLSKSINTVDKKVDTVNTNLTNSINTVNTNLTNSINTVNTRLTTVNNNLTNSINTVNSRVTTVNNNLTNSINTVNTRLTTVNNNLTNSINTVNTRLTTEVTNLSTTINTTINQKIENIENQLEDIDAEDPRIGNMQSLSTTAKDSVVNAINEVFRFGSNVKQNIVAALQPSKQGITINSSWEQIYQAIKNLIPKFTVIYHANNTTYNVEYYEGDSVLSPTTFTPSKSGWNFIGWRTDTSANANVLTSKVMGTSGFNLYAVFNKNVILSYSGGTGATGSVTPQNGYAYYNDGGNTTPASFNLASNGFTRSGYMFTGWDKGAVGASITLSENATATAQWESEIASYYPPFTGWGSDTEKVNFYDYVAAGETEEGWLECPYNIPTSVYASVSWYGRCGFGWGNEEGTNIVPGEFQTRYSNNKSSWTSWETNSSRTFGTTYKYAQIRWYFVYSGNNSDGNETGYIFDILSLTFNAR